MEIPGGIKIGHFKMISSGNGALQSLQSLKLHHTRGGCCCAALSRVLLFATPWTEEPGGLQSTGFSRQEYWSGLSFSSPGDLCHLVSCNSCIGRQILRLWFKSQRFHFSSFLSSLDISMHIHTHVSKQA